jgi:dTDP-4-dehydrorhamnose reductase
MSTSLIVGGDSQLGVDLASYFDSFGFDYIKTTRKQATDSNEIHLDLLSFNNRLEIPNSISTAYFLAGISDTQYCEANQQYTHHVNVKKTLEVIRFLDSHSVHTVFISSASVFDGRKKVYLADEVKEPRNFYGLCKSEVEDSILKDDLNGSIMRVGKIVKEMEIIKKWQYQLDIGEKPNVFSNRFISPIAAALFMEQLVTLGTKAFGGVSQISACDEVSYLELFDKLFPGLPKNEINDVDSHEHLKPSGLFNDFDPPPSWAALDPLV